MKQSLSIILTFSFLFSPLSVFAYTKSTLTALTAPVITTYTYSPTGNITSKSDVGAYEYTDLHHPHAVTKAGASVFTYDKNGNLVSDGSTTYAYDYANRLAEIVNASGTTKYVYDDTTNRIQKRLANGGRLSYVGNEMEADEAGDATDYIFAGNDRLITIDPPEGLLYNIQDHLSSASLIVKGATIIEKLDYYPYGTERVNEKTTSFSARHTFTDKEKDAESGLQYFGARYYNPTIGRFTSVDPVALAFGNDAQVKELTGKDQQDILLDPQGLNPYAYARNNPLKNIDAQGQWFETAFDVAMFGLSLKDYKENPSFWNGASLIADGASVVLPIPTIVGGIRHGDDAARFLKGLNRVEKTGDATKAINSLSDSTLVCRGGACSASNFLKGSNEFKSGLNPSLDTPLTGISVNIGEKLDTLLKSGSLPKYGQYGQTTAGNIKNLGGTVIPNVGNKLNPTHANVNGLSRSGFFGHLP